MSKIDAQWGGGEKGVRGGAPEQQPTRSRDVFHRRDSVELHSLEGLKSPTMALAVPMHLNSNQQPAKMRGQPAKPDITLLLPATD